MNKLLSIFLIGLCLFAAFVPAVRAHDDNDEADENDRDVEFETEDATKIEIKSYDSVLGNEIKFRAETTSDGLYIEVEFHSEPEDSSDDSDSSAKYWKDGGDSSSESDGEDGSDDDGNDFEVKFRAVFESLISYTESNGVAGYQADENGQVTELSSLNWNDFVCTSSVVNNASVIDCSAGTSDLSFGIVAHIVDQPTEVSGVAVNPTGIKIDVYFYKSSSQYLAVVVGFQSDSADDSEDNEIEVEDEEDKQTTSSEGAVNFADFGFFSWVTSATINGQNVTVVNSDIALDSSNDYQEVVFSFETDQTGSLYWDPVLAVQGTSKLSSDAVTMLPSLFLLAALAFLAL